MHNPSQMAEPLQEVSLKTFSELGHRPSYNSVLESALREVGLVLRNPLPSAVADFFPMLDDNIFEFSRAAILNGLRGKRTVGLFFRPGECFLTSKLKYRFKRALFFLLKRLPHTHIITILPFQLDDRFQSVATGWIHDPQFWDLGYFDAKTTEQSCAVEKQVKDVAQQRRILVALGSQTRIKGFDLFCRMWCEQSALREKFLFVAAGKVDSQFEKIAAKVTNLGGVVFNRQISDEELFCLYRASDMVWSCYAPDYNQSSGILGRAFQFGKPSLIREGSFLASYATLLGHAALPLPFGDVGLAARRILDWNPEAPSEYSISRKVENVRQQDLAKLAASLRGDSRRETYK